MIILSNKKVLLRKCKRHTTRRVASTCYAALSPDGRGGGTPSSSGQGGTPFSPGWGYPILLMGVPLGWGDPSIPTWEGGTSHLDQGRGTPTPAWTWEWGTSLPHQLGGGTLSPEPGKGVPSPPGPGKGYPHLPPGPRNLDLPIIQMGV